MFYYNYAYQQENYKKEDVENVIPEYLVTRISWYDSKFQYKHEANFELEFFYRTKEKAPLIYFDSKNLSQNSGIKRYEIKLNDLTVASFKNDTKVLIKLAEVNKEIAKEAQNLDNLTVEFYDGAGDIKGRYQIRVDKERPEDIEYIVSSAEKTVPIKKVYAHVFKLDEGIEDRRYRYFYLFFKWGDISKNKRITNVGSLVYYADPTRSEIQKYYPPEDEIFNDIKRPVFHLPSLLKQNDTIRLRFASEWLDKMGKGTFEIIDYLETNHQTGEIAKGLRTNIGRFLEIPRTSSDKFAYTLTFDILNTKLTFHNPGTENPTFEINLLNDRPRIIEGTKRLDVEYRYKINNDQVDNIFNNYETQWSVVDYLSRKRND